MEKKPEENVYIIANKVRYEGVNNAFKSGWNDLRWKWIWCDEKWFYHEHFLNMTLQQLLSCPPHNELL